MNELFTFNCHQLQTSLKRPSSTDNPPSVRKRIIKSILSKRLSQQDHPSFPNGQDPLPSTERRPTPPKKVRFNLQRQDMAEQDRADDRLQITKKGRSLDRPEVKPCIVDALWRKLELDRSPLEDIKNERKRLAVAQRPCSNAESRTLQRSSINQEVKETGRLRDRRILSLKLSPKIVPVSDSKLPKVFKMKYLVSNNVSKPEKPKVNIREILSCEIDRKLLRDEGSLTAKHYGVSQLHKMQVLEERLFQKLYHPRQ